MIFWIGFSMALIVWLALVAFDHEWWAVLALAGACVCLQGAGIPLWATVSADWVTAAWWIGGYVAVGLVWTFPKWWFYARRIWKEYQRDKNHWEGGASASLGGYLHEPTSDIYFHQPTEPGGKATPKTWKESESYRRWKHRLPPKVSNEKDRILGWVIHWPVSMIATLLDDPLREVVDFFVRVFNSVYATLAVWARPSGLEDDFEEI